MRHRRLRPLVPTALGVGLLLAAGQAPAAIGTGNVSVTVVAPLSVAASVPMEFGTIAPPSAGAQDFALDPDSGVVTTAGGDGFAFASTTTAAQFKVTGYANADIGVTAGPGVTFGGGALVLTPLVSATVPSSLDGSGAAIFTVGGTLNVASTITAGSYGATFDVTVEYQ